MIPRRKSMFNTIVERTPLKDRPGEMLYEIVLTMPQMSMIWTPMSRIIFKKTPRRIKPYRFPVDNIPILYKKPPYSANMKVLKVLCSKW